jgi:F0F1-type ATP synthase gamma subunit
MKRTKTMRMMKKTKMTRMRTKVEKLRHFVGWRGAVVSLVENLVES